MVVAAHDFKFDIERTINVAELSACDGLSLYCLDHRSKQFVFVETKEARPLETAPFLIQKQFEKADGLFAVPYECLEAMAAPLEHPPIFILSIGRVCSTLLSKLFNAIPEVQSFSEPEVFSQIGNLRRNGKNTTRPNGSKGLSPWLRLLQIWSSASTGNSSLSLDKNGAFRLAAEIGDAA